MVVYYNRYQYKHDLECLKNLDTTLRGMSFGYYGGYMKVRDIGRLQVVSHGFRVKHGKN